MSDYDSEADTDEYEPPEPTWRWLEGDEFMETEYMQDEFCRMRQTSSLMPHGSRTQR